MIELWNRLSMSLDALALRWRVLVFVSVAELVLGGMYQLAIRPLFKQQQQANARLTAQADAASHGLSDGSLAELLMQVDKLNAQLKQHRQLAEVSVEKMVPAKDMAYVLGHLLARDAHLTVVKLETLPPEPLQKSASAAASAPVAAAPADEAAPSTQTLYRHGMRITLRGGYFDLQNYLTSIERLPNRLIWGAMSYKVDSYPLASLTLTVYTLSEDKTWLKV